MTSTVPPPPPHVRRARRIRSQQLTALEKHERNELKDIIWNAVGREVSFTGILIGKRPEHVEILIARYMSLVDWA